MPFFTGRLMALLSIATLSAYVFFKRLMQPRITTATPPPPPPIAAAPAPAAQPKPTAPAKEEKKTTPPTTAPAASATSVDTPTFTVGERVRVVGLSSKPEFNGQSGRIIGYDQAKGRFNISLAGGRTLQIKPANIAPPEVSDLSATDMSGLTLANHNSLTPAHAERVIEMLRAPGSAVEAGCLLRCCCAFEWTAPIWVNKKTGEEKLFTFNHAVPGEHEGSGGLAFVLVSDAKKLEQLRSLNEPPKGFTHDTKKLGGLNAFNRTQLDGIGLISLDPHLAATAEASRFTALPAAYFPSLMHMSEALIVEESLKGVVAMCHLDDTVPPPAPSLLDAFTIAATAFSRHTFFCFNAAPNPADGTIVPITAQSTDAKTGKMGTWMLIYTCEMVAEHARPHLEALGAFPGKRQLPATAVPAVSVLKSLKQPENDNAGVHINEFVPGMNIEYKALGLRVESLVELFKRAGTDWEGPAGVTV